MQATTGRLERLREENRHLHERLEAKNASLKELRADLLRRDVRIIFLEHLVAKMDPGVAAEYYRRALRELEREGIKV